MEDKLYVLYRTDMWHSKEGRDPLVIADSIDRCCEVAADDGATEDQIKEIRDSYYHQSQLNNTDYEYEICTYNINESLIS